MIENGTSSIPTFGLITNGNSPFPCSAPRSLRTSTVRRRYSSGSGVASTITNRPSCTNPRTSHPKLSELAIRSSARSANVTSTPGSPNSRAPLAKNCRPKTVLPVPVPPANNVVRPRGNPPRASESKPGMPTSTRRKPRPSQSSVGTAAEVRSHVQLLCRITHLTAPPSRESSRPHANSRDPRSHSVEAPGTTAPTPGSR